MTKASRGRMGRRVSAVLGALFALTAMILVPPSPASADGTETLGPATIPIAEGTGIVVAGTGLFVQPSSFDVVVPADAVVEQVILYWESGHQNGDLSGEFSDETINVNGIELTAPHAGGPSVFYQRDGVDVITSTHRVDITDLGLVEPGTSTLTVGGLDTDEIDDGAGVVVIYSQGGVVNDLQVFDGNDIAFANFAPPRDTTVPQTYTFAPENRDRDAEIGLMAASTHTTDTFESPPRPSALLYTVDGVTTRINDPFLDIEGREFDTVIVPIVVPAGATDVTVQLLSDDNGTDFLPASLVWLVGTFALDVQQFGSLAVSKAVAANVDPAATFDIDLDCTDDAFDETLTLAGGAEATIADIPIGTTCTVSETPPTGFEAPTYTPSDTVSIDTPGTTITVTVTNALQPGSLVVRKEIAANVDSTATFDIDLDCSDDAFDETLTLAGGAEATIADIPVGTTCTVSEAPLPGFETPVYTPSDTVTIDTPDTTVTITVTNTAIPNPPVLPETGGHIGRQLWLAAVLLAVGAALVAARRHRDRAGA
jgi:hypothetical protein